MARATEGTTFPSRHRKGACAIVLGGAQPADPDPKLGALGAAESPGRTDGLDRLGPGLRHRYCGLRGTGRLPRGEPKPAPEFWGRSPSSDSGALVLGWVLCKTGTFPPVQAPWGLSLSLLPPWFAWEICTRSPCPAAWGRCQPEPGSWAWSSCQIPGTHQGPQPWT